MARRQPLSRESETDPEAQRRARRLRHDLRLNPAGAEVILKLRAQVLELQTRVRVLEAERARQSKRRGARLAQYRDTCIGASWFEMDDRE